MTNLNIAILSPEDLIKYTRPTSPLEVALYDALALAMKDKGQEFDDLTDELNEMEKSLERVNDELSEAQDKIKALEELNAQEPVAWYGKDAAFPNENKIFVFNNKDDANAYGLRKSVSIKPLYTHPTN